MSSAYNPHGAAMLDYFNGNLSATVICVQDGERDDVPVAVWFRETPFPAEQLALDLCRGRVLDLGAGAGIHTLELQRRGLDVAAIDIAPECVQIMKRRGVKNAQAADLYAFEGGPFDTIICLCNGLDKVGRLSDLPRFLARMRGLLASGGQLLADSADLRAFATPEREAEFARKQAAGRYYGELDMVFEYTGVRGEPFTVLQVDSATLTEHARANAWECEVLSEENGHYLARLTPR